LSSTINAGDRDRPAPLFSGIAAVDKAIFWREARIQVAPILLSIWTGRVIVDIVTIMTIAKVNTSRNRVSRVTAEPAVPPYRRIPAYLIRRLQMISAAVAAEAFEDEDMPLSQWAALTIIEHHPGIDQSGLAETVSIDKTNTGRVVDQLEAKGLVERRPNGSDRRVWMLRCTPLGHNMRKRLLPRALGTQDKLLSCLKPHQRELLIDLMSQVVMANEKYIRPGAGRRKSKSPASGRGGRSA
jgi:DNA-binding MarR family transcriptional regulator